MGKNNVNKDHYIENHGRERQGEEIVQKYHKQNLNENRKSVKENYIPGEAPVGEKKEKATESKDEKA